MAETELLVIPFETAAAWERWLADNHAAAGGLWLKLAKKGTTIPSVTYAEALEVALCFGWIDGQKKGFDERYWLQKFTPRRRRSKWSRINREKAEGLIAAGRMRPAGRREVEAARADGRWERAYASQSRMTVPADLQARLDKHPAAQAFFETLDSRNRYAILYRIQDAKRVETRTRRIEQFVAMLAEGKKLY